jgi:hypothetical protein
VDRILKGEKPRAERVTFLRCFSQSLNPRGQHSCLICPNP